MTVEPSAEVRRTAAVGPLDRLVAELGRPTVGTVVGLLWIAAMLIGWRRLTAALDSPLEPAVMAAVGVLLAGVAAGVRVAWQRLPAEPDSPRLDRLVILLPTIPVLSLGAALSLPGTDARGLVAFWTVLVAGECWAYRPAVWRRRPDRAARPVRVDPPQEPSPHASPAEPAPAASPAAPVLSVPGDDVLQQLTRSQAADGSEELSGWLRMPFDAGQRTASAHVAFCPPFPRTPELSVRQLDGPSTRIKTAQLLPHGTRLDLKLAAAADRRESVLLEFSARSQGEG